MITVEQVNNILGVDDTYKQPAKLLSLMLDEEKRVETFRKFLELETDMSYEWFQQVFEDEHADRKNKKQDFTPQSLSELMARLVSDDSRTYFESTAGNGGMMIQAWQHHRVTCPNFWAYDPKSYWYQVEELSDRSIPFLIFNMAIRGMNGAVLHGDSLEREFKNVYFIRNMSDEYGGFSEVIVMPHTEDLQEVMNIHRWVINDGDKTDT